MAWRAWVHPEGPKEDTDLRRPTFLLAWPVSVPAGGCLLAYSD